MKGAAFASNTFGLKRESGGRLILRGCNVSEFRKGMVMEREWKVGGGYTGTMFGSVVGCEMVVGCKVDNSKRREDGSHVGRVVNAIAQFN